MFASAKNLWIGLGWLVVTAAGCVGGSYLMLERQRTAFEAEARTALRWVSDRARDNETLVDTLVMLQPGPPPSGQFPMEARLGSLHPSVQKVLRRDAQNSWPAGLAERLSAAEAQSRRTERPVFAQIELTAGRYLLVRAGEPASFALQLDLRTLSPDSESHPLTTHGQVRAWLEYAGQRRVLAPGAAGADDPGGWRYGFRQRLSAESLPVDLVAVRRVGWSALPWAAMAAWCLATAMAALGLAARLGSPARRETSVISRPFPGADGLDADWIDTATGADAATAQTAPASLSRQTPLFVTLRDIDREPPELAVARGAIRQAARHARRTSEVITRMSTQPGSLGPAAQGVRLDELLRDTLELLEPDAERLGVVTTVATDEEIGWVLADPILLEQIVHQVVRQALQAVARVPAGERRIELTLASQERELILSVRDSGPGYAPEQLRRLFETTGMLPAGTISLGRCRAVIASMGGSLTAAYAPPRGTLLRLALPRHA